MGALTRVGRPHADGDERSKSNRRIEFVIEIICCKKLQLPITLDGLKERRLSQFPYRHLSEG
jgi:hypothetical protein